VPEPPAAEPPPTGLIARFRRWFAAAPLEAPSASEPVAPPPPEPIPEPESISEPEPATNQIDLTAALDSLGKAHHRPFSRA
jgi:hypothetical protein